MKLLEMVLVRRMLPLLEETLSGGQYAYQQGRSTELLLGDLSRFVEDGLEVGWHTYVVGLDIQGAFDSASLGQLVKTLGEYGIPEVIKRFIAIWLTDRSFRIKMGTLEGVLYSEPREPSRGVPQGGVLSPLLWILHVNRVASRTQEKMEEAILLPKGEWRLMVQLFADDISAAVMHSDRRIVIVLAEELARTLIRVLRELGLEVAPPKCNNFIVDGGKEARKENTKESASTYKQSKREQKLQRMQQDVEKLLSEQTAAQELRLPFPWVHSFRLLGVVVDCGWTFHQHFMEIRTKLAKRLQAMRKVSGTVWGLESRILAVTVHALLESVVGYGLATAGSRANALELRALDTRYLNRAARRVVGTNITMRTETLMFLADLSTAQNQCILKQANVLDRTLRAKGTNAQAEAWRMLQSYYNKEHILEQGVRNHESEIVMWEPLRIKITEVKKCPTPEQEEQEKKQEKEGSIWEITRRRALKKGNIEEQNSIYHVSEETISDPTDRAKLSCLKDPSRDSYNEALTILLRANWSPQIICEQSKYIAHRKENQIFWWKLIWDKEKREKALHKYKRSKRNVIRLAVQIVPSPQLAICQIQIWQSGNIKKQWIKILGLKFTKEPVYLEGHCLLEGLLKLLQYLERDEAKKPDANCRQSILEIQSKHWKMLNNEQIDRWFTYGVMTIPQSDQTQFNILMGKVTRKRYIRKVLLDGQPIAPKSPIKQELNIQKLRIDRIEKWIAQEDVNLPMIQATQEEVKERLKELQQEDEQKTIQYLANRESDRSISAEIIKEWKLDRSTVREILQHLSSERKLQTTFTNLVGATRFKTVKNSELHHTICPNCAEVDTWKHCLQCYGIDPISEHRTKDWLPNIEQAMRKITTDNPAKYQPAEILHANRHQKRTEEQE